MAKNIIAELEAEESARLITGKKIPEFAPGDTLRVNVRIKEGERERVQAYEGVCIARAGGGLQESFTVRKISFGEGVERIFPLLSPNIESIEVKRRGVVRRAKLYYLRDRRGKSARIAERAQEARTEAMCFCVSFIRVQARKRLGPRVHGDEQSLARTATPFGAPLDLAPSEALHPAHGRQDPLRQDLGRARRRE